MELLSFSAASQPPANFSSSLSPYKGRDENGDRENMRPAPSFSCTTCRRTIGKRAGHNVTDHGQVLCSRCIGRSELHPELWPDCAEDWHDVHDHLRAVAGTRAATAAYLGLWGKPIASPDDLLDRMAGMGASVEALAALARARTEWKATR